MAEAADDPSALSHHERAAVQDCYSAALAGGPIGLTQPAAAAFLRELGITTGVDDVVSAHYRGRSEALGGLSLADVVHLVQQCKALHLAETAEEPDEVDARNAVAALEEAAGSRRLVTVASERTGISAHAAADVLQRSMSGVQSGSSHFCDTPPVVFKATTSTATLLPAKAPADVVAAMKRLGATYDGLSEHWMLPVAVLEQHCEVPEAFLVDEGLVFDDAQISDVQFVRLLQQTAATKAASADTPAGAASRRRTTMAASTLLAQDTEDDMPTLNDRLLASVTRHDSTLTSGRSRVPLASPRAKHAQDSSSPLELKPTLKHCLRSSKPHTPSTSPDRRPNTARNKLGSKSLARSANDMQRPASSRPVNPLLRPTQSYMSYPTLRGTFTLSQSARAASEEPPRPTKRSPTRAADSRASQSPVLATPDQPTKPSRPGQAAGQFRVVYTTDADGNRVKHYLVPAPESPATPAPPTISRPASGRNRPMSLSARTHSSASTSMSRVASGVSIDEDVEVDCTEQARRDDGQEFVPDEVVLEHLRDMRAVRYVQRAFRNWRTLKHKNALYVMQRLGRAFMARRIVGRIPVLLRMAGDKLVRTKRAMLHLRRVQRVGRALLDRKALGTSFASFDEDRALHEFMDAVGVTRVLRATHVPETAEMVKLSLRNHARMLPAEEARAVDETDFAESMRFGDQDEEATFTMPHALADGSSPSQTSGVVG